jgi:hypothetical protein
MKKKELYFKTFKTKEDWDETYWEVFREGSRYGKKDLLDKFYAAFNFTGLGNFFKVMKDLI